MSHKVLIQEVESWLIDEALGDPDITRLFEQLCARLGAIGVPVDRSALVWPTLHPLFRSEQIFWNAEDGARLLQYAHDTAKFEAWRISPFYHVLMNDLPRLRRRLTGPDALMDFDILKEFRGQGFTDYLLTASEFRIGEVDRYEDGSTGIMASWATRREGGFSDSDLEALDRIQQAFAVAARVSIQRRVMANLVNTYLGRSAGWKALTGEIRRGDGDTIRAVVYYADLRGSTRLSGSMEGDAYLSLLRDYYDCVAQPAIDEGGEILDYIGDAVLAIFPIKGDTGGPEAVRAACRAMEAALDRRDQLAEDGKPMKFCISIACGDVMFGNIGVPERLSFTAIGQVVNQVARMDDISKDLGRAVLVTDEVAAVEPGCWLSLGDHALKGMEKPVELFARACARDSFDTAEIVAIPA